jgi:prepilin-type processing-associated H-X9-DG protein
MRSRIPLGFGDLLVGGMLVLLIGIVGIDARQAAAQRANMAKCASNLHQIGLAILLYQNDCQQMYPETTKDTSKETGDNPKPVWATPYQADNTIGPTADADPFSACKAAPALNDVTASFFLLMRNEQLTSAVFNCPSANRTAWDFGGGTNTAQNWTNWNGYDCVTRHECYSYQNPFASKDAIERGFQMKNPDATFAVAADINPGGDAETSVTINSTADKMKAANSPNHQQDGQNVLYGDGHAEWQSNPFCGSSHDNIYTAGGPELTEPGRATAVIAASSVSPTDSILLPSMAEMAEKTLTPAEIDKLKLAIRGQYATTLHGYHAVLTVDDKTIGWVTGPLSVKYDYQVTGSQGQGLALKLTAPETVGTAVVTLNKDDLHIEMSGEFTLNFPWQRLGSHPTTGP